MTQYTRRRTLGLIASVAGVTALSPWIAGAAGTAQAKWSGVALGADATILLDGVCETEADELIGRCVSEIQRLEQVFSLYHPDSTLSRLNKEAVVLEPEQEFVELLSQAKGYAEATGGVFDPTVQPLWDVMARHFAGSGELAELEDELAAQRPLVDYRRLHIEPGRVWLEDSEMAVTLNGIAQGYITDRVAALLKREGFRHVLIDLGEQRALGPRRDSRAWQVGIRSPMGENGLDRVVDIWDGALASSGGYGYRFDDWGRYHHLYDPRRLDSANAWLSMSVKTANATEADALSTAFSAMSLAEIESVRKLFPSVSDIYAIGRQGSYVL